MKKLFSKKHLWKWLLGSGVVLLLVLLLCILKLNNREEPVKPVEKEEPELVIEVAEEPQPDLIEAIMQQTETDPYHGELVPTAVYNRETLPRIVCWGDSLTEAGNGQAYPDVLATLTDAEIINYGLHSDSTKAVAIREGALPVYVSECVIPGGREGVSVNLSLQNGKKTNLLKNGNVGINPCMIGSVRGNLELSGDSYVFTRSEAGEAVQVTTGTRLMTQGALQKNEDDVVILFTGANDGLDKELAENLISTQKQILDHIGSKHYIVIGVTYAEELDDLVAINEQMAAAYGEHFLDIRDYFVRFGLEDAGITPTKEDEADIAKGLVPASLRQDRVHGTSDFYALLAHQVYRKLMHLGYLPLDPSYAKGESEETEETGQSSDLPRVVFWGDSLTESTGGGGVTFPKVVQEEAAKDGKEIEIRNYGVYAEKSSLIAARAGGNPMRLNNTVTIPGDTTPVEVVPVSDMFGYEMLLVFGGDKERGAMPSFSADNSINPCVIAGVEGYLSINADENKRYFTRKEPGDPVVAKEGEQIFFWAMRDKREDDILVIWSGSNDDLTPANVKDTIKYIQTIIDYTGADRYIVLNMMKIEVIENIEAVNKAFADAFGDHCLDIYSYLLNDAMDDAGITPTAEDKEMLAEGRMPMSLRSDMNGHFNAEGYTLIGQQIYKKLCEMGYL